MTRNKQPAPGASREAGSDDHPQHLQYKPLPTISDYTRHFHDYVRGCTCCGGPILPLNRRAPLCSACADWISGKTFREELALAEAARLRRRRLIASRRAVVDLAVQAVLDVLFENREAA